MYSIVPTYKNNRWTFTEFSEKKDFITFVKSQIKPVGQFNLKNTDIWNKKAKDFQKNGYYTEATKLTKEYIEFWEFEKYKCTNGVIINDFYLPPSYYFYINYCPIYDFVNQITDFPEIWDCQYWYFLHKCYAELTGKFVACLKARRKGFSYMECADIHCNFVFVKESINKIIHRDDDPVNKCFTILQGYREFTNTHTGWIRHVMGSYPTLVQQIEKVKISSSGTKSKSFSGNKSRLEGVVTRMTPSKGVGSYATRLFFEEAGTNSNLIKSIKYNEKTMKQGGTTRGLLTVGGSVGELKDCEDLRALIFNPKTYGFHYVEDDFGNELGLFIPENWNYVEDIFDEDGETVLATKKYYDEDGNSFVEEAKASILKGRREFKEQSPKDYRLYISQAPLTIKEAFDEREENIFPTGIINERISHIEIDGNQGDAIVLRKDSSGKIMHFFAEQNNKVKDFPLKKDTVRDGQIIVYEYPIKNAPVNLYFAGIDPVSRKKSEIKNTQSLMSCYIIKGDHEINGEFSKKQIVAEYCGRYDDFEKTYEAVTLLWEWYNARPLIENNNESYISWLIEQRRHRTCIKNIELENLKEINPNYTKSSDLGVTMASNGKTKDYIHDLIIEYLENPISKNFNTESGEVVKTVLGVDTIKDIMLLKELAGFGPKVNVDRIISFGLALWAVRVFNEINQKKATIKKTDYNNYTVNKTSIGGFSNSARMFSNARMFSKKR